MEFKEKLARVLKSAEIRMNLVKEKRELEKQLDELDKKLQKQEEDEFDMCGALEPEDWDEIPEELYLEDEGLFAYGRCYEWNFIMFLDRYLTEQVDKVEYKEPQNEADFFIRVRTVENRLSDIVQHVFRECKVSFVNIGYEPEITFCASYDEDNWMYSASGTIKFVNGELVLELD